MVPRRGFTTATVAFVIIVAAIVGGLGAGALMQVSSPSGVVPSGSCAHSLTYQASSETTLANGTEVRESTVPAFVISPGTTMDICVLYSSPFDSPFEGTAYNSAYSWMSGGQLQPTREVNSTTSPSFLFIALGQSAHVTYAVRTGRNASGFYGLSALQLCVPIPLAVGYGPSQVNASDFPGLFGIRSCPAQVLLAQVVGYTGATVALVSSVSRFNPTINITEVSVSSFPAAQGAVNITFRMNVRSFSRPLTVGVAMNESILRVFEDNPQLVTLPAGDYCSWYPDNTNAVNSMNITTFEGLGAGSVQVSAPTLHVGAYSNASYTVSVLIKGPIASYTAVDPTLYASVPGSPQGYYGIAAYFPVSISGQLQSLSGSCGVGSTNG